jgi:hypothetical protein
MGTMKIDQVKLERHDIAPDGDLILLYKKHANRPVELRVSTTILKSQSIYFKGLSGRWLETLPVRPDGLREMAFDCLDPDAMLIIMKAAHLKFQGIPDELNVKLLHKVAKYVHMFDMFPAVCTLARPWIQYVRMFVDQCNSTELAGYLLGIMWVFNLKEQFKKATRSIIVDFKAVDIDLSRTLIDQSMFGKYPFPSFVPLIILNMLTNRLNRRSPGDTARTDARYEFFDTVKAHHAAQTGREEWQSHLP